MRVCVHVCKCLYGCMRVRACVQMLVWLTYDMGESMCAWTHTRAHPHANKLKTLYVQSVAIHFVYVGPVQHMVLEL